MTYRGTARGDGVLTGECIRCPHAKYCCSVAAVWDENISVICGLPRCESIKKERQYVVKLI